ncbi:TPA: rhomboid family intramembrane serine protease [Streptococcus pyogenes]|nr:rhomboid family intramembrane serine protease [Streptococcus pyogenes]HER0312739.1 rhomboid family intramembrane serine protease [Streptococcus pyogenes]HER3689382.1 rhomboid family intramembrane serine protease [Streptococcus pyogenes]
MTQLLKRYPITIFLLGLTGLIFIAMQVVYGHLATGAQAIYQVGGMFGLLVKAMSDQLWRLVTPIFIHIGFGHFFVNGLTLYFVGQIVEDLWGSRRFLLLYVLSGVMGNAFTFWLTPETVAAGASTSLFGLFAAIVVLSFLGKNQALKDLGKSYQTLIVVNLLMNLFMPNVSMAGHIGGVVGGALLSIVFPTKMRVITVKKTKRMLALVSYGIILVGVLVLGFL